MKKVVSVLGVIIIALLVKLLFFNKKEVYAVPPEDAVKVVGGTEKPYTEYYRNGKKALVKHYEYIYYDKQEKEIARFNPKTNTGTKIVFYKDSSDACKSIKSISEYKNDTLLHQKFYDENEKVLASGQFKDGREFQGSFYQKHCTVYCIEQYKDGIKIIKETFNKNNELLATLNYKEDKPFSGTEYNCHQIRNYKNGRLHGKQTDYYDESYSEIKSMATYKQGNSSGEFLAYSNENEQLVKLNFNNDELDGSQFIYNNEKGYYYEMIVKNKAITTFNKFALNTNNLLKKYPVKLTTEDEFTFDIEPASIEIEEEDINQDGYTDIVIKNYFYRKLNSSYYLYDALTEQFVHISEFTDAQDLKIVDKNKIAVYDFGNLRNEIRTSIATTYNTSDIHHLKKVKVIEDINFIEQGTIITTQLYPVDYKKYPLLDESLPPISLLQNNKETVIEKEYQEITLKNGQPFSFTFTGDISKERYPDGFYIKVHVTLHKKNFEEVDEGVIEQNISFFGLGHTLAITKRAFAIEDNANNLWIYKNGGSKYSNLTKETLLNNNLYTFSHLVDTIPNYTKNSKSADFLRNNTENKPLYVVFFIDKNRNKRLDKNEFFKVKLMFN